MKQIQRIIKEIPGSHLRADLCCCDGTCKQRAVWPFSTGSYPAPPTPCACADLGGADEWGRFQGSVSHPPDPLHLEFSLVFLCVRGEMPSGKQSKDVWEAGHPSDSLCLAAHLAEGAHQYPSPLKPGYLHLLLA